jgi:uncharacterized protein with FMN-binding domain
LATASTIAFLTGGASAGLMFMSPVTPAPSLVPAAYVEMIVSDRSGYANLRQRPTTHSKLLYKLPQGTTVVIVGKVSHGSWLHVRFGDTEGYIEAALLKAEQGAQSGFIVPGSSGNLQSKPEPAKINGQYRDGSYRGTVADAYYGQVQVQADISGGRLASVRVLQFPADRWTSRSINAQALPLLEREVVAAQSTRVDIISGATLTSTAYLRSLNSALGHAGQ